MELINNNELSRPLFTIVTVVLLAFLFTLARGCQKSRKTEVDHIKIPAETYKEFYELNKDVGNLDIRINQQVELLELLKDPKTSSKVMDRIAKMQSERNSLAREYNKKVEEKNLEDEIEEANLPYPIKEKKLISNKSQK